MFHMLTCFNLEPGRDISSFKVALDAFCNHMHQLEMVEGMSPIGERQSDTIMDTDEERDHQYFFTMTFRDRAQVDAAVELINSQQAPTDESHRALFYIIKDPIFICWQDVT